MEIVGGNASDNRITPSYAAKRAEAVFKRLPVWSREISYGLGQPILRKKFIKPPSWVLRANQLLTMKNGVFYYLRLLNKPGNQWSLEDLGVAIGIIQSGSLLLEGKSSTVIDDGKRYPELKEYRLRILKELEQIVLERSGKKTVDGDELPKVENVTQFADFINGLKVGASDLCDSSGAQRSHSMTQEILKHCALFWPEVEKMDSVTELHAWLKFDADIHCSIELVEKVCSAVKKSFRPRGRPKKNPNSR